MARMLDAFNQNEVDAGLLAREFAGLLRVPDWVPTKELLESASSVCMRMPTGALKPSSVRRNELLQLVRRKWKLNSKRVQEFCRFAAERRIYFSYPRRVELSRIFDSQSQARLSVWLEALGVTGGDREWLVSHFMPIDDAETLRVLESELNSDSRRDEMLEALFGGFVYCAFEEERVHKLNDANSREAYESDYFAHLKRFYPRAVARGHAMTILHVDAALVRTFPSVDAFLEVLADKIVQVHASLTNHCYFAVLISPLDEVRVGLQWEVVRDVTLFAEKYRHVKLTKGYFRPDRIEADTLAYVPGLSRADAKFELANEGMYYKDCFVIAGEGWDGQSSFEPYSLLLLFQKNERDENPIPCPSCRSHDVRGNSYPVLGVRSWECANPICPDRSKYNRGKRYSLVSIINQQATELEENQIPISSLRRWKLDVVRSARLDEIVEFLARHYSLSGDTIETINIPSSSVVGIARQLGRSVVESGFPELGSGQLARFKDSAFFRRFLVQSPPAEPSWYENLSSDSDFVVHNGSAQSVLRQYVDGVFDGVVTSPPYYNAREYSQWPNVYAYLHDMYNIAQEVFRTLKDGAPMLFNIFDYFDNENTIVYSDMGRKRMILGAYMLEIFSRVGYRILGNMVWFKGEIEGKRANNMGNMSPYYQAPLNAYEHVFILSKGEPAFDVRTLPSILRLKPVVKIVRGENRHGHTAPFPDALPEMLLSLLRPGSIVLDPFGGSLTTGRVAHRRGYRSVSIEIHRSYCELGVRLWKSERDTAQYSLFSN